MLFGENIDVIIPFLPLLSRAHQLESPLCSFSESTPSHNRLFLARRCWFKSLFIS